MASEDQRDLKKARWKLSGKTGSTIIFLVATMTAEFLVVLYAMGIGIRDQSLTQVGPLTFSPLFHLIPATVIVVLSFTWIFLTSSIRQKPQVTTVKREKERVKSNEPKLHDRIVARLRLTSPAVKAAFIVLIGFGVLILLVSFITYPTLVYRSTSTAYEGDASFLGFVKSVAQALSPIFLPIAGVLRGAAPAFGAFAAAVGGLSKSVSLLDSTSKYLIFQNAAAWILVLVTLLYTAYLKRGHLFRKARRL
jgi:hypothetical protein